MLSGVGSLLSGLSDVRPVLLPQKYHGYTHIFNLPYPNESDRKSNGTLDVSTFERQRFATIIENNVAGLTRANSHMNYMIFPGYFTDMSNHQVGNIIVQVESTLGVAENVVIGDDVDQALVFAWSGLSHTNLNYLWLSTVEESDVNSAFQSSRYFRNLTPEVTTVNEPPSGVKSVLAATFMSGVGFDPFPEGYVPVQVAVHVLDNQGPHGSFVNQQYLVCSGVDILNAQRWPYAQTSGAPTVYTRSSLVFENELVILPNSSIITSGIFGHTLSGTQLAAQNRYIPFDSFYVDNLIVGNLIITSGLATSGCNFRQDVSVQSGVRFNGVAMRDFTPLVSGRVLSGIGIAHIHSTTDTADGEKSIWPKYPGAVFSSYPDGSTYDKVSYNQSLEGSPTLYRYGNAAWVWNPSVGWVYRETPDLDIYIRQWMPAGFTQLDRIEVHHRLAHADDGYYGYPYGYPRVIARIIDALGTTLIPAQGSVLHNVSGVETFMIISGIDQTNLAAGNPWDLKLTLANVFSGSSVTLGEVRVYYKTAKE